MQDVVLLTYHSSDQTEHHKGLNGSSAAVRSLPAQALSNPRATVGAEEFLSGMWMRQCFNFSAGCWPASRPEPLSRNGKYMNMDIFVCVHISAHYFMSTYLFSFSPTFKSEEWCNDEISTLTLHFQIKMNLKTQNYHKSNL